MKWKMKYTILFQHFRDQSDFNQSSRFAKFLEFMLLQLSSNNFTSSMSF